MTTTTAFWQSQVEIGFPATFQVALTCPDIVDISLLHFDSLHLSFSDGRPDAVISTGSSSGDISEIGSSEIDLVWTPGTLKVFQGTLQGESEGELEISAVKLVYTQRTWNIEILLDPSAARSWHTPKGLIIPAVELSPSVL